MSEGAICGGYDLAVRRMLLCPTEGRRRRFVATFKGWYGWTMTCLGCGDSWDGEEGRAPRPFYRNWRKDAIARARRQYAAVTVRAEDRRAALQAVLEATL